MGRNRGRKRGKGSRTEEREAVTDVGTIVVENPLYLRGSGQEREAKITATRALRDDPLARMHDRGQISDAQYAAGRRMQELYEAAEVGRLRSQDPTREPVDGGGHIPDVMSDWQLRALRDLNRIYPVLGKEGSALLRMMLCDRRFPSDIARIVGVDASARGVNYIGRRLRECLETLAKELGLA